MAIIWSSEYLKPKRSAVPVYLFAASGVSCLVCIYGLRHNNLTMVHLRQQVYDADRNNADVQGALSRLQHYVTTHMNTDLTPGHNSVYPPIQLQYTYARQKAALNPSQPISNEQLYNDAQKYCEQQNPTDFSGRNRVPCIQQYVTSHGGAASATQEVPDSLYKFDFVSPQWSPDLAGWSLLLTVGLLIAAGITWLHQRRKK